MSIGPQAAHPQARIDFNAYLDGLYGYAIVLSRNSIEAQDLVQEACLRALQAIGQLRPDGNVKSWLFTILRNAWFNQLRHRRTAPDMVELGSEKNSASDPADTAEGPHELYASKVEQERVRVAIQQLPVEFREIIILREYEELSYQEIASVLGCPAGTVMSRLARARSKLRELLADAFIARSLEEKNANQTSNETAA